MTEYAVRYYHKISPSPNDVGPNVWLSTSDLKSKTTLAKALRERRVLESGRALQEYRIETDGKIVAFPSNRGGRSIWHSITLTPVSSQQKQEPMSKSSKMSSKKTEKVCLMKGYAYELDPDGGSWDKAKDDSWEMVLIAGGPATVLGKRRIDGSECVVAKRGGKIYAQTAIHVTKC